MKILVGRSPNKWQHASYRTNIELYTFICSCVCIQFYNCLTDCCFHLILSHDLTEEQQPVDPQIEQHLLVPVTNN